LASILIVDDEPNIRRMLSSLLVAEGHMVTTAGDGASGLKSAQDSEPDVVLLDLALPDASGTDAAARAAATVSRTCRSS
jgi:two-component system, NtrC family, nitrogen regulation response regulator NtrX